MEWLFDGIGTSLVTFVLGLIFGGTAGYKIAVKRSVKQNQTAGDNSNQFQVGNDYNG